MDFRIYIASLLVLGVVQSGTCQLLSIRVCNKSDLHLKQIKNGSLEIGELSVDQCTDTIPGESLTFLNGELNSYMTAVIMTDSGQVDAHSRKGCGSGAHLQIQGHYNIAIVRDMENGIRGLKMILQND